MREIRTSGSEGGGAGNSTGPPYPYIGIGGEPRGSRPSHTTVRTGPYTAVRLVKPTAKSPGRGAPGYEDSGWTGPGE